MFPEINSLVWTDSSSSTSSRTQSYISTSYFKNSDALREFITKFPEGSAAAISVEGGVTWLTAFAFYGNVACVKAILESLYYCAKLLNSAEQYKGKLQTPLQWAIEEEHWNVVKLLLEYNPQMDLETYKKIIQCNK